MTLFAMVDDAAPAFQAALMQYFDAQPDRLTIDAPASAAASADRSGPLS